MLFLFSILNWNLWILCSKTFPDLTLADCATNYRNSSNKTGEFKTGKKSIRLQKGWKSKSCYHSIASMEQKSILYSSTTSSFCYIFLGEMKKRIYKQYHMNTSTMKIRKSFCLTRKSMEVKYVRFWNFRRHLEYVGSSAATVGVWRQKWRKYRHNVSWKHLWL